MSTADPGPYSNEAFFRERFRRDAHRLFQANGESKLESLRVAKDSNGRVSLDSKIKVSNIKSIKKSGKTVCAARGTWLPMTVRPPWKLIVIQWWHSSCQRWSHVLVREFAPGTTRTWKLIYNSVVRQRNTLDRFLVTLHVFEEILGICEPFTPYLDSLQAFGQRENDDEKFRSGYRWQRNVAIQQDGILYQRFYRLRNWQAE